jgi:hypothetical protein
MGKYDALQRHLAAGSLSEWRASFAEIEAVLDFPLPRSAYVYPAWWSNDPTGHSHSRAWLGAGWKTARVDLQTQQVTFLKAGVETVRQVRLPSASPSASLQTLHGALKGVIQMVAGTDLTKPTGVHGSSSGAR